MKRTSGATAACSGGQSLENAIDSGESSLAADLNQRIQRCRTLIETLGKIATINDRDYLLISRALVSIQNRASSRQRRGNTGRGNRTEKE